MLRDQYGRPVYRGDTVTMTGKIVDVIDDPEYVNCTVQLDQQLPPSGAQMRIDLNTLQVVKTSPGQAAVPVDWWSGRLLQARYARQAELVRVEQGLSILKQQVQRLLLLDQRLQNY